MGERKMRDWNVRIMGEKERDKGNGIGGKRKGSAGKKGPEKWCLALHHHWTIGL
jgi:hypothetical protein